MGNVRSLFTRFSFKTVEAYLKLKNELLILEYESSSETILKALVANLIFKGTWQ